VADREDAVEVALRALRHRDRSAAELDARLAQRGVGAAERAEALEALERVGYVDDGRFALLRAEQLAGRGAGDALIRHDLVERGVAAAHVEAALAALEPERERVTRIVARRGPGPKTARYLASKGFGEDAVADAVAANG
jgi:SOS response regulatory protein OraA/RecX